MTDAEVTQLRHEIDAVMYAINSQKIEIERLTEALDGETTENMRLKHEIERLQKQEETVAKLYHKKGVKDFAKYLIDKAEGVTINTFDIPDYVAEMESENDG